MMPDIKTLMLRCITPRATAGINSIFSAMAMSGWVEITKATTDRGLNSIYEIYHECYVELFILSWI